MASRVEQSIPGDYQLQALRHGWRFQRAWHRGRLDLVSHVLPPRPDALVLDAAAGAGILTCTFRPPHIVSADLRVSACEAVRGHTAGAKAVAARLDALPFAPAAFGQIYLLEAIEHLDAGEGARALRELRRVARPGAMCLVTTPNDRSYWPLLERLLDAWAATPAMAGGQHVTRYDRYSLTRAVEAAGWTVIRTGSFNLIAPVAGLLSRAAGSRAVRLEAGGLPCGGPLLFVLCQRG